MGFASDRQGSNACLSRSSNNFSHQQAAPSQVESGFERKFRAFAAGCMMLAVMALGFSPEARAVGNPASGSTLFNNASYCVQCHTSPPEGARLLAANNGSHIQNAINTNIGGGGDPAGIDGMGQFRAGQPNALSTAQLNDIASYIGLFVVPTTADTGASVAYNSGPNAINLTGSISVGTPFTLPTAGGITVSAPANGTITSSSVSVIGGNVTTVVNYTPNTGYIGADGFTYTVHNNAGSSVTRTVSITVNAPPAPVAGSPFPNVAYGSASNAIDLTASISGVTNGAGVTITVPPANGTINSVAGNVVTYTPTPTYSGNDPFSYTVAGPGGTSNTGVVTVSVGLPPAPVANAAARNVGYNSVSNALDLAAAITNPATSVTVTVAPANGTINSVAGTVVTYTPNDGYYGPDTFSYTATGPGGGPSAAAAVTITVANPAAPAAADSAANVPFNTSTSIDLAPSVSGVYSGVAIASPPANGSTSLAGTTVTYTPTAGYSGGDSFTYTATGPGGTSAPATVTVTVGTLAPTAGAAVMNVPVNTATTLDLAPFITGSSISGVSVSANPSHGTVTVSGTSVIYTPVSNYFGADSFSYLAYGNAGTSPPATVSVTVTGRPDPARDAAVTGLIAAQVDAARRFSRAQISNFQSRMESLHRRDVADSAGNAANSAGTGFRARQQHLGKPAGAAYQPAASLTTDPMAGLPQRTPVSQANPIPAVTSAIAAGLGSMPQSDPAALLGNALLLATNAAQTSAFNLSSSTGRGDGSSMLPDGVDVWVAGGVRFGTRDQTATTGAMRFTTDGVSIGADKRISDDLAIGVGLGYAQDKTRIGTDGTESSAKGITLAGYGSYQPAPNLFLDGLVGYGRLDYRTERYVTPVGQFASSDRDGDFLFGSLTGGYEFRTTGLMLSPYGRLDLAQHRLDRATETGAGAFALTYDDQKSPAVQFSLGLRAESAHETGFGWIAPRMRIEFQHDFKGAQDAKVAYADLPGVRYVLPGERTNRNSVVLGVGGDFVFRRGLTLSLDYQTQRASGREDSQAVMFRLTKDLDGRSAPMPATFSGRGLGIRIDAGHTYDDNVSRSNKSWEQLSDSSYNLNLSKRLLRLPLSEHARMTVNAFAGGEKFRHYGGLDRVFAGADAELQYRTSGAFTAPTFALFGNVTAEQYESTLRDGHRVTGGVSVSKPVTDRISLFGALARNWRSARSAVFDTRDYSARLNLDYAITSQSTLYLSGEFRRGDIVSSGRASLENIDIAEVLVQDDVFTREQFFSYRFEGRTVLLTVGYNLPLGPADSLDLSWRRVESTPDRHPGFATTGPRSYVGNQLFIVYLTRF